MRFSELVKRPLVIGSALVALTGAGVGAVALTSSSATTVALAPCTRSDDGVNTTLVCADPATPTVTVTATVTVPGPTVTASPAPASSATPTVTTSSSSPPPPAAFPNATNTGYQPTGVTLTTYTGSTSLPCGTVLDSVKITGDLEVTGGNGTISAATPCVTIKRSLIVGTIHTAGDSATSAGPLVLTDDEFAPTASSQTSTIVGGNFYLTRVNVHDGAHGGIQCDGNCVVTDSWTHDFIDVGATHYDGIGSNGLNGAAVGLDIEHSSIGCNFVSAQSGASGGCSADLGLFGDFSPIAHVTVNNSLFLATNGQGINADPYRPSYCVDTNIGNTGKAYPSATYFVMNGDTFQRGPNSKCGQYGAVGDWKSGLDAANHNSWANNKWDDGTALPEPT